MKQKFLLKTMLLLCALIAGSGSVWAEDVKVDITSLGTQTWTNYSLTSNNVTISTNLGTGSAPTTNNAQYRWKTGNIITISTAAGTLKTIQFKTNSTEGYGPKNLNYESSAITSSGTDYTWTAPGGISSASFSVTSEARLTEIHVTYTPSGGGDTPTTYTVTYYANGATSGSVPTDNNSYESNASVTVLGNTGYLAKTGNAFGGWNTQADGLGTTYSADETFTITANTTLYAKWNPYTITAQSNNNSYGTVSLNGFVITANPSNGYTYASDAYTVSSGSATVEQNGNEFTVTPTSDCTVIINFEAIPTHTATFSINGETSTQDFAEGAAITFPADPGTISGKSFMGWTTATISGTTDTAPSFVNTATATMSTSDITYYAVFADVIPGIETTVSDKLTRETTGVSSGSSTYSTWSEKTSNSDAVYKGNSAGGNNAIQLRTTNSNSGIVTTTSGGKATKVKVTWNNNTASDRTLDIYGKNTAYSAASDLYNNSTQGTKLGSIVCGTSDELTITGNYDFIGLRSSSNAMYLDEIDIEWTTVTPDTYSNYCTTVVDYVENSINDINDSYTVDLANNESQVDLTGATATSGAGVQFTVLSSTIDANDYDLSNGVLTVSGNGVMTIRVYVDADATFNSAEKIVTVTVVDNPVIGYAGETEETAFGTNYTVDEDLIEGGAVSLVSGNTAIATVEGLVITPVAVGSVTITVNTVATDIYHAGSATFTLNITAPEGSETAPISEVVVFEETFANSTGGPLSTWGGSEANGTLSFDNNGWNASGSGAGECAKFGTSGAAGSATTPSITVEKDKTYSLSFKAAPWSTEESKTITVTVSGGKINDKNVVTTSSMSYKQWNEFCYDIVATATSITIEFKCSANRFFLDDVKLTTNVPVTTTVTLNASGYATFCSQYPLDFTNASGFSAWQITSIENDVITFSQITGSVKGGTGILLKGTAGETVTINSYDSDNVLSDNKLVGTLAPTYVEDDTYYGLSGEYFKKVSAGKVPAGKALLPASVVDGAGARLTFVFEDAQGIKAIEHPTMTIENAVYNLNGQRVDNPKNGLYIVNGKKVMVK